MIKLPYKDGDQSSTKDINSTNAELLSAKNGQGATEKSLGTYHLAANANMYEIQRSNNFEFVVDFEGDNESDRLDAGLTLDEKSYAYSTATEILRMSVQEAFIPHFTQNPIEVKRGNTTIKYAGVPEFQGGDLQVVDYIGADTVGILMAWQNLSYNVKTEKVGIATDYKRKAHLIEYSPDLQVVRSWTLYGCWVSGLSEGSFNNEQNDKRLVTVNIAYDKAVIDSVPVNQ